MFKFKSKLKTVTIISAVMLYQSVALSQADYTAPPMTMDVNSIQWTLSKTRGDGGMVNEYSWTLRPPLL